MLEVVGARVKGEEVAKLAWQEAGEAQTVMSGHLGQTQAFGAYPEADDMGKIFLRWDFDL